MVPWKAYSTSRLEPGSSKVICSYSLRIHVYCVPCLRECECHEHTVMYQFVLVLAKSFREPVWPNSKASGWYTEGPRFDFVSAFLSIKRRREKKRKEKKRFGDNLEILPLTINKTLKWLSSLPTLMQIIVMVTVYIVLGRVCLFPHLLGCRSPPLPLRRQLGVKRI